MAESSPTPPKMDSPRSRLIDTAAPFESVKAAVSLFGEKADFGDGKGWKVPTSAEKRAFLEVETRRAQEDVAKVKNQLAESEKAKCEAIQELEATKLICLEKSKALEEAIASREQKRGLEAELAKAQQQLSEVTAQLVGAKQETESLKLELVKLKDLAVHDAEAHAETASKAKSDREAAEVLHQQEKEALRHRLSRCEETLAGVNAAIANLQEEKSSLSKKLEEWVAAANNSKQEVEELKQHQSATTKDVEAKLATMTSATEKLEKELVASKEAEARSANDAAEAKVLLSKLQMEHSELKAATEASETELEHNRVQLRKLQEEHLSLSEAFAALQLDYDREMLELQELKAKDSRTSSELQQCQTHLKNSQLSEAALRAAIESLQADYDNEHAELVDLKVKDSKAAEENASLTSELEKIIDDLTAVTSAEAKAKEQVGALTDALQQVTTEADQAKKLVAQSTEEAIKAKADAEQAKAALSTCESRLQAALKEVEAAKAAETLALSECKSLRDKISDNGEVKSNVSPDREEGGEVSISREEYDALNRKIVEVEDLARKKVDAALAQVGAAQAGEREMLTRLHAALADLDISREAAGVALKRAEKAEEAKSKIEGELRKHRSGNEQRRKNADHSRELGIGIGTPPKNVDRGDVESARDSFALPTPGSAQQSGELVFRAGRPPGISERHSESLGQFLNMVITQDKQVSPVIPETPKLAEEPPVPAVKKKKTFQAAIKAVFARSRTRVKA